MFSFATAIIGSMLEVDLTYLTKVQDTLFWLVIFEAVLQDGEKNDGWLKNYFSSACLGAK